MGLVVQKCEMLGPFGTTSERNLNSLFIMNSAGEEDEEQVDYGEDSGGENGMSFNGQARSTTCLQRRLGGLPFRGEACHVG